MHDVIIIGAGFAGLAAARHLQQAGIDNFRLLEARNRVGGRTQHGTIAGIDIDIGGMWLGPTQTRLKALAEGYQVSTYKTPLKGKAVYRISGNHMESEGEDFSSIFNLREGLNYMMVQRRLGKLWSTLDIEQPWNHPQADTLDATKVEQWICANMKSERLRQTFRMICFSLFCAEASQISMLFFLHYVKSGDNFDAILSAGEGGAQNMLFEGGVHQVARKMAEEIGDRLMLNQPVREIAWSDQGVTVTSDSETYQAKRAIIAIPPTMVSDLTFSPELPQPKKALHARLSMGSAIKYWVAYETPFWRDQGYNGLIFRDDVPCSPCFDVTPASSSKGLIAGFFDGDHALNHGDNDRESRKARVLNMLADHYGEQALHPIEYVDKDWTSATWSRGCYGAYAPPGVYSRYGEWLRKPIGALNWAGTETSPRWTGYIDGAIRSGEAAAQDILPALEKERMVAS
ncbi:flavin monoamine oxidase family protein [Alterisphingorhabdus coralli]|uniref:FAD-dependent oxidoreductase n=1 Tax=Alterisphingorhabdus coralli TaxID=3071408 RepID=A0AA97I1T1_9SPHN|nr:FAD-dependent oxidoreductase [Parasphingorhabdus sp. SCSIO 66989]WOE75615.1 FAD-dependent oxidoreductase [Parasphingorhabdus sp. SCSIO 66989]